MNFGLSEEQEMIVNTVRSFVEKRFTRMKIWSS